MVSSRLQAMLQALLQAMLQAMLQACAQSNAPSMCTYVTDGTNEELLTLSAYVRLSNARRGGW